MNKIMNVYLNSSGTIQALKGERLVLNCTATGKLNTRVNITWNYPGKVRPVTSNIRRFFKQKLELILRDVSSISKKTLLARTQISNSGVTSKRLVKHPTHMLFYNILTLPRLQQSHRGTYTCHVSSGENAKEKQVNVTVYGEELWRQLLLRSVSQTPTHFSSHFRSAVHPPQAQTWVCH